MSRAATDPHRVILVVDDEAGMRDMLGWRLEGLGFDLRLAGDGAEAIRVLESERVDLVITDLTMPRVGGFGVLEFARSRTPAPSVIAVTGFATVETAVRAMRQGAFDFLLKPFDDSLFVSRVKEALGVR